MARKGLALDLRDAGTDLGPCMRALTQRQRAFVDYVVFTGTRSMTHAARAAGFEFSSYGSLKVQAHRLSQNPAVQAAMAERSRGRLGSNGPMLVNELLWMAKNRGHPDQFRAIDRGLGMVGFHVRSEHKIVVEHTSEELVAKIGALAEYLGLDPSRLLGAAAPNEIKDITPEGSDGAQD